MDEAGLNAFADARAGPCFVASSALAAAPGVFRALALALSLGALKSDMVGFGNLLRLDGFSESARKRS